MSDLVQKLRERLPDIELSTRAEDLKTASRDTSIFERHPEVVAYPKTKEDVAALVAAADALKKEGDTLSLTARAAGTCMSGGPLSDSVVVSFTKYMNKVDVRDGYAVTEPGAFYRDFEKKTLEQGLILPSYPASRLLAAMGGIVNNDSGGERTLEYGKTRKYVEELEVVLSDGSTAVFGELALAELEEKKKLETLEGAIYRQMHALITDNHVAIAAAKPAVSKNSAGYALWEVFDPKRQTFNLAKLITGAQGTLCFVTKAKLRLVKPQPYRSMLVIFLSDLNELPTIVRRVLAQNPESFESYDDHTFSLAIKLLPQMLGQMGFGRALRLGLSFLPEVGLLMRGGIPKLVLMAEFSEDTHELALTRARESQEALADLSLVTRIAHDEQAAEKYWVVRREAFAILRKKLPGLTAAAFIDDFVVPPDTYPEFLPKLFALLDAEQFMYAITGHIGDGNFHIFPLIDLKKESAREVVQSLSHKVYDLVIEYGGTTTGEHNDGIIRTPYLPQLFGEEMVKLFEETKRIFDPKNLFNPGKKVGGTFEDIDRSMLQK